MTKQFAIKDTVANNFKVPNPFPSEAEALRAYAAAVNFGQPGTLLKEFPGDLEIYEVGSFDEVTGVYLAVQPRFICKASDLLKVVSKEDE